MAKNSKKAEEARAKAEVDRKKAEEAIKQASIVKQQSQAKAQAIIKKAQEAAAKAARAEAEAIRKEKIASVKITATKGSIAKSEVVRVVTKAWEATTVHKHQVWKTYKNIKKNYSQATKNTKMVSKSLNAAEKKIAKEVKFAALHKNNIAVKQRVIEAKRAAEVIRKQKADAEAQRIKIANERKIAEAKARELSIAAAKARAKVEWAYRAMVMENNKVCGQCRIGRQRIKVRRTEIDHEMQTEAVAKAKRAAVNSITKKKDGKSKVKKCMKKHTKLQAKNMLKASKSKKVKSVKKASKKFFTSRFSVKKGKGRAARLATKGKATAAPKKAQAKKKLAQIDELDFEDMEDDEE